jgi:hypothetical protein
MCKYEFGAFRRPRQGKDIVNVGEIALAFRQSQFTAHEIDAFIASAESLPVNKLIAQPPHAVGQFVQYEKTGIECRQRLATAIQSREIREVHAECMRLEPRYSRSIYLVSRQA